MPTHQSHPHCPFTDRQVARFWSRLIEVPSGCWNWLGCQCGDYGRIGIGGKVLLPHRVAFLIANGSIESGKIIAHQCDNPLCCNPSHLKAKTNKQNSEEMIDRGRSCGPRGERAGNHVLTQSLVTQIKSDINDGKYTQNEIARKHGVARSTIHAIRCELSWAEVEPRINDLIPEPHRKFSDFDYVDIRQLWREGWTLKSLSEKYACRVDVIQAIIHGKRGKGAPVGLRIMRQNKTKHSGEIRKEMLRRYLAGETQVQLAKEFGMSKNGISLALQSEQRNCGA